MANLIGGDLLVRMLDDISELKRTQRDTTQAIQAATQAIQAISAAVQVLSTATTALQTASTRQEGSLEKLGARVEALIDYMGAVTARLSDHESRLAALEQK